MQSNIQPNLNSSNYKQKQYFGADQISQILDQDIITRLKYDPTGNYLCLGDNFGRFQSHNIQNDPLRGTQYPQSIVDISWLRPQGKFLKMFTTNKKTIKLWKAFQKVEKKIMKGATKQLGLPKLQRQQPYFTATQLLVLPRVHPTQINSISHTYNQQYLLSTCQQQNLLWSLQKPVKPYIANQINSNNKFLQTRITCAKMHPTSDSIFAYGMNRQQVGLCDIRTSSSNRQSVIDFKADGIKSSKNFFSQLIRNVGDVQFIKNGKYIISRQYINVKVWDIANTKTPVLNICVQQNLKSSLVTLFEGDNMSDQFGVSASSDNKTISTGSYNGCMHLIDIQTGNNTQYQLNFKNKTIKQDLPLGKLIPMKQLNTKRKTSVLNFNPVRNQVAVSCLNCFFIYSL